MHCAPVCNLWFQAECSHVHCFTSLLRGQDSSPFHSHISRTQHHAETEQEHKKWFVDVYMLELYYYCMTFFWMQWVIYCHHLKIIFWKFKIVSICSPCLLKISRMLWGRKLKMSCHQAYHHWVERCGGRKALSSEFGDKISIICRWPFIYIWASHLPLLRLGFLICSRRQSKCMISKMTSIDSIWDSKFCTWEVGFL